MCKLRPELHGGGLIAKVSSPRLKMAELRLSGQLICVFVWVLVVFVVRWGIFPLYFCFAMSVSD